MFESNFTLDIFQLRGVSDIRNCFCPGFQMVSKHILVLVQTIGKTVSPVYFKGGGFKYCLFSHFGK